jgi:hypothetical protein
MHFDHGAEFHPERYHNTVDLWRTAMKKLFSNLLGTLFFLYIIMIMVTFIGHQIRYAKSHSFAEWSLSPERHFRYGFRSLFWPFFLGGREESEQDFPDWSKAEHDNALLYVEAVTHDVEATELIIKRGDRITVLALNTVALEYAEDVREEVLNKAHPDLPEQFRNFIMGLKVREKQLRQIRSERGYSRLRDNMPYREWLTWYSAHEDEIFIPARASEYTKGYTLQPE